MNRRRFGQWMMTAFLSPEVLSAQARPSISSVNPKFSVMLWTLKQIPSFDDRLAVVAEAGYQGVELTGEFHDWTIARRQQIMARMRELGLVFDAMSGVKAGFAVPEESESFKKQFAEHLQAAQELECKQVILLSGRRVGTQSPEEQRQTSIDTLKRAADVAAKSGIEILIEPIDPLENPTIFLQTVTDGFEIARAVNRENVRVLYDFYHEQRAFGNLIEKLEKYIDLVSLVHIADVPGRHEPGTGEVHYDNLYRKLAELHYQGNIAMEFYPITEPVSALRKERLEVSRVLGTTGPSSAANT